MGDRPSVGCSTGVCSELPQQTADSDSIYLLCYLRRCSGEAITQALGMNGNKMALYIQPWASFNAFLSMSSGTPSP